MQALVHVDLSGNGIRLFEAFLVIFVIVVVCLYDHILDGIGFVVYGLWMAIEYLIGDRIARMRATYRYHSRLRG